MRSTKQIAKETVCVSTTLEVKDYYKHYFKAEELGYDDMAKYLRDFLTGKIKEPSQEEMKI